MMEKEIYQAGGTGIALLLVGVVFFIIKWLLNFISCHLERNTTALTQNTKVTTELRGVIKELSIFLKAKNGSLKT